MPGENFTRTTAAALALAATVLLAAGCSKDLYDPHRTDDPGGDGKPPRQSEAARKKRPADKGQSEKGLDAVDFDDPSIWNAPRQEDKSKYKGEPIYQDRSGTSDWYVPKEKR